MPEPVARKPCPHCGQVNNQHASTCTLVKEAHRSPDNGHTVRLDVPVRAPIPSFDDEPEERPWDDPVSAPSHYNQGGVECIDAIRSALGTEGFRAFCAGCIMRYIWRHPHKGAPVTDLRKAAKYLEWLIDDMTEDATESAK